MRRANEGIVHRVGDRTYGFRTPTLYDPAKARRVLARQGVRRPTQKEFEVAARHGIEEIGRTAGDEAEGERQAALIGRWYELLVPTDENDIDEPDAMKRGKMLMEAEAERQTAMRTIFPEVSAIEATLERHWPPYAELVADRAFWDDVSRIEIVRLLLDSIDGAALEKDGDGMLTDAAYRSLPRDHLMPLATEAFRLLAPDETQRKN